MTIKQDDTLRYFALDYDNEHTFLGYYEQIKEILNLKPKTVLEIGLGGGVVSDYLRKRGIKVTTFDFNKHNKPDIFGDVRKLDEVVKGKYDIILCAFVLEHIPFSDFRVSIEQMSKHCKNLILVLPNFAMHFFLSMKLPSLHEKRLNISIPLPKKKSVNVYHYWEIGLKGYPLRRILGNIREYFRVKKCYTSKLVPYHKFFVLESRYEKPKSK